VAPIVLDTSAVLALTKHVGVVALTADQDWAKIADILGVEVRMIR
jgi:PIN domain nuclease of toxin-antitoxin system